MIKITVKGEAKTAYPYLQELDGIDCQDDFADYFNRDSSYNDAISSGRLYFKFEDEKLWSVTEYISLRELTQEELDELLDYTQGQWSDGIGEGFEQFPCYEGSPYQQWSLEELEDIKSGKYDDETDEVTEVFISPWFNGQEITIKQELINN